MVKADLMARNKILQNKAKQTNKQKHAINSSINLQ